MGGLLAAQEPGDPEQVDRTDQPALQIGIVRPPCPARAVADIDQRDLPAIAGSLVVLAYGLHKGDRVIILGQLPGTLIYIRNLWLIQRARSA